MLNLSLQNILLFTIIVSCFALIFAWISSRWIVAQEQGDEKSKEIGNAIKQGAMAFLSREYKILSIFVLSVAVLLFIGNEDSMRLTAFSFFLGSVCSSLAGYFGMQVATSANNRTATAAVTSLNRALSIAFKGGAVMGLSVVGLSLLGISILLLILSDLFGSELLHIKNNVLPVVNGFAMGASSIALFARVGGGIFTKAADVGADLVGKIEAGIPEDDPRNPATIADNVGDNVGDVAGMGADLFESYTGAIIGSMVLGAAANSINLVILPLVIAGVGILVSAISVFLVKTKEGGDPQRALNIGTFGAAILMSILIYPIVQHIAPTHYEVQGLTYYSTGIFYSTLVGLFAGIGIGIVTEHYTGMGKKSVDHIAKSSTTGPATNIISGLGIGMKSTLYPTLFLATAIMGSYYFAGLYGIALASLGMLATTGIQLAVDAYGPIADNAGGIAEMSKMPPEVREKTDKLDAVGNTTAAIGKGFAIGSAALTSLALFAAFKETAQINTIDITHPKVITGLIIGAMLPFLFSALAIEAVGRAAFSMIKEVRRQFKEIPGILKGEAKADYAKCVDISTSASIKEMVLPGLLAVLTPVVLGFSAGANMLGGVLAGVMVSGVMLALFMSNTGGAWDNAKKSIEVGQHGGKGSEAHKASIIGDTVGDPFKDTAGPSLNILIKLMSIVALVIAPLI